MQLLRTQGACTHTRLLIHPRDTCYIPNARTHSRSPARAHARMHTCALKDEHGADVRLGARLAQPGGGHPHVVQDQRPARDDETRAGDPRQTRSTYRIPNGSSDPIHNGSSDPIHNTYPPCPAFTVGCSWCSCPECGEPIGAQVALNWNSLGITSFIQVRRAGFAAPSARASSALRDAGLRARRTRTATRPSSSSRATSTRCRRARARSSRSSR